MRRGFWCRYSRVPSHGWCLWIATRNNVSLLSWRDIHQVCHRRCRLCLRWSGNVIGSCDCHGNGHGFGLWQQSSNVGCVAHFPLKWSIGSGHWRKRLLSKLRHVLIFHLQFKRQLVRLIERMSWQETSHAVECAQGNDNLFANVAQLNNGIWIGALKSGLHLTRSVLETPAFQQLAAVLVLIIDVQSQGNVQGTSPALQ